jgi:hypothetical protein
MGNKCTRLLVSHIYSLVVLNYGPYVCSRLVRSSLSKLDVLLGIQYASTYWAQYYEYCKSKYVLFTEGAHRWPPIL